LAAVRLTRQSILPNPFSLAHYWALPPGLLSRNSVLELVLWIAPSLSTYALIACDIAWARLGLDPQFVPPLQQGEQETGQQREQQEFVSATEDDHNDLATSNGDVLITQLPGSVSFLSRVGYFSFARDYPGLCGAVFQFLRFAIENAMILLPWQIPLYAKMVGREVITGDGIPRLLGLDTRVEVVTWWLQWQYLGFANSVVLRMLGNYSLHIM
jgi:hypothetical protein